MVMQSFWLAYSSLLSAEHTTTLISRVHWTTQGLEQMRLPSPCPWGLCCHQWSLWSVLAQCQVLLVLRTGGAERYSGKLFWTTCNLLFRKLSHFCQGWFSSSLNGGDLFLLHILLFAGWLWQKLSMTFSGFQELLEELTSISQGPASNPSLLGCSRERKLSGSLRST